MFKGVLKEQAVQVGIGFVLIVVLLGTFILPEWMSNNFMYGLSRGLAVLGLMILWRTNLVSFGHALFYGFGSLAYGIKDNAFNYFLLFVYVQVFGLAPNLAGLAILLSKTGILIPFVGVPY